MPTPGTVDSEELVTREGFEVKEFNRGDKVAWEGYEEYGVGAVLGNSHGTHQVPVRFELFEAYDDSEGEYDSHLVHSSELLPVKYVSAGIDPEDATNPDHYRGDLVMQVIESMGLDFALGNTVKYVCVGQGRRVTS